MIAPVQLIYALETSLKTIIEGKVSLEDRFKMHREASQKFKKEMQGMGFKTVSRHYYLLSRPMKLTLSSMQVSLSPETSANGMTAVYFPEGFKAPDILPKLLAYVVSVLR